jgi:hypothetical protein
MNAKNEEVDAPCNFGAWQAHGNAPIGEQKVTNSVLPSDEIHDPPYSWLGMVDVQAYFMFNSSNRLPKLYMNPRHYGAMFEPSFIPLF